MPRLVRRKPLFERLKSMLNPMDFLLWLSEELETRDWDSKIAGTQLGLGLNFVFLLARANSGSSPSNDDIFSDETSSGWVAWLVHLLVWTLLGFSCANAFYYMTKTRKYRLFAADVEVKLSTPSARRVKIASSPSTSSPLRYLADMVAPEAADSRAHPDKAEDVWELSVWDPLPISVRLVNFFSPVHVLVYIIFLPLAPLDPRPSVTVFNTLLVQFAMTGLILFQASQYEQQAKDNAIVQKEVMHEYDTKFVHPRVYPVVRDAGTQISDSNIALARESVQVGTPTTLIRRSFATKPNAFASSEEHTPSRKGVMNPSMFTPTNITQRSDAYTSVDRSRPSASRQSLPAGYVSGSTSTTPVVPAPSTTDKLNFGGSMGIHSHHNSPLKKVTSLNNMNGSDQPSPRNSREMASYEQSQLKHRRQSSPVKYADSPGSGRPNPFAPAPKYRSQNDRFPSMR